MTTARPGLQPERTALAWRRTSLGLGVVGLGASRLAAEGIGVWALVPALACVAACGILWIVAGRRTTRAADAMAQGVSPGSGAGLLLATAAFTCILGVGGLVLVVSGG
ncbi:MAG: hypothetical protein JWR53_1256 [Glaciihabitans sp.]|jgi:uncharacterized membrane protein YidH (DUF202 family)|nr:hypothetical protein [Glaciihabitans sp.]MCU1534775.1 hypothetical protein [Glaciihabitans sp.]